MTGKTPDAPPGVDVLLITGRIVQIQQARSAFVLISRRFLLFLTATFLFSFLVFAAVSGGQVPLFYKAAGWLIGAGVAVIVLYFILYLAMNYLSTERRFIILSPVLSLIAVGVATPIVLAVLRHWVPQEDIRALATAYFLVGLVTAEVGMVLFVHLVRDPLVARFEALRRRSLAGSVSVRVGSEVFPLDALCYIEAENQYVNVHLLSANVLVAGQLTEIERQLDSAVVFRPHRSYLVFRHGIAAVETDEGGALSIRTVCGRNLPVARRRMAELRVWLAEPEPGA